MMLGKVKLDQVDGSAHLGSIFLRDGGFNEDVKSRIANASELPKDVFSSLKKQSLEEQEDQFVQIEILETMIITVAKYGFETLVLRMMEGDVLDVCRRN